MKKLFLGMLVAAALAVIPTTAAFADGAEVTTQPPIRYTPQEGLKNPCYVLQCQVMIIGGDVSVAIWGTNGTSIVEVSVQGPRITVFDDPIIGFEDPLVAFDDPIIGIWVFEVPLF